MRKVVPIIIEFKPYVPKPHPMQHRIDEFMAIPSLYRSEHERK
jgi:hypothetical protein